MEPESDEIEVCATTSGRVLFRIPGVGKAIVKCDEAESFKSILEDAIKTAKRNIQSDPE